MNQWHQQNDRTTEINRYQGRYTHVFLMYPLRIHLQLYKPLTQ